MVRDATAFMPIAPRAPAKVTSPDWNGVMPNPV